MSPTQNWPAIAAIPTVIRPPLSDTVAPEILKSSANAGLKKAPISRLSPPRPSSDWLSPPSGETMMYPTPSDRPNVNPLRDDSGARGCAYTGCCGGGWPYPGCAYTGCCGG